MDSKQKDPAQSKGSLTERRDKEAAALRENLRRRKQQQRAKENQESGS